MGLNYRALCDLFGMSKSRENLALYTISIQMVEIYNEKVRDLLVADGTSRKYPFNVSCSQSVLRGTVKQKLLLCT